MLRRSLVVTIALLLTLSTVAVPRASVAQGNAASRALQHAAAVTGQPLDTLTIVARSTSRLPQSGVVLDEFKVMASDGQTVVVSFDASNGELVDADVAAEAERQQRAAAFGVIEPGLSNALNRLSAESMSVAIWVAPTGGASKTHGIAPDYSAVADRIRQAQQPVAEAARGLGAELAFAELVPVLFGELTAEQIATLAQHPAVLAIEPVQQNLQRTSDDDGATSDRYTFIWSTANGAGAKVAVHEDDGVDNANPFLVDPVYWCSNVGSGPGGAACTVGKNIQGHATSVAGVVASTHRWRRGGAWGIGAGSLLSANFQSFSSPQKIVNSASWAIASGADTLNMSWGGCSDGAQSFFTRWVDYLVQTYGVTIVVSSGNRQCGTGFNGDYVLNPSLAWNTISVGSYWDSDTGLRNDDVLSSFSSFRNPTDPNTGRTYEKPDVTGMGGESDGWGCHGVETTGVGNGADASTCGTSFAAPDVSALTALIVGKNSALRRKAEGIKAIVMAGATHNIADGLNYMNCPTSPVANDCRDGAGAIDAYQTIQNIVTPGNWRYSPAITPASFDAAGYISYPVSIVAGKSIRAAIAWNSTAVCTNLGAASQACATDTLNADLDLQLVAPNGTVVARSASLQNSAEVVDYKTTTSGTYTIRVRKTRFAAGTTTNLGVAWNLNTVDRLTPLTGIGSMALNTTKANQTTTKRNSFWDTYVGPNCFNQYWGLEKVYRITTTQPGTITATLTNQQAYAGEFPNLDVIILRRSGPANLQNEQTVVCGDTFAKVATATNQPAGTYFIVVDGSFGSVAKFDVTVNFTP